MTTEASGQNIKVLIDSISDNIKYFDTNNSLSIVLKQLKNTVECCASAVTEVQSFVCDYDFDDENQASGYRSFIDVFDSAIEKTSNICARLIKVRGSFLFRADNYAKQINEWQQIFYGLSQIFDALIQVHREKTNKTLFTYCTDLDTLLSGTGKSMNQKCFYGDNLGFQFCQSMHLIVKFLVVAMASYSNYFFSKSSLAVKIFNFQVAFTKYFYSSEERATKFLKTCKKSTTEFCRSYWFLTERRLIHTMPNIIAHSIEINKLFDIPAESLELYSEKFKTMIDVPLPRSHSGVGPVSCRLMSARKRRGMFDEKTNTSTAGVEASKHLIFHVHGGGFVSQTSKSHEIYLREWAAKIDVPILSIDYSLAPEAPFPRAIEEVFYAYCWALKNPQLCGTTGENVVFVGDSAGGNINTACILKCIDMGIKKPKGLLNIYTPFMLDFSISPSRFMSLIDPIIPYDFSTTLHESYCREFLANPENRKQEGIESSDKLSSKLEENHLLSPFLASNYFIKEFPKTRLVSSTFDPFVDDCVEFGKRLKSLDVDVEIDVVKGLPHGFLYFTQISKDSHNASMICLERIKSLLE